MFKEGPRYKDSSAIAGGEGWLVNDQQQKVVRFRNDMARSCRVGHVVDLQLEAPEPASADDPAADASAQRHRGVEHHEKDGLATMPPTCPLTCRKGP